MKFQLTRSCLSVATSSKMFGNHRRHSMPITTLPSITLTSTHENGSITEELQPEMVLPSSPSSKSSKMLQNIRRNSDKSLGKFFDQIRRRPSLEKVLKRNRDRQMSVDLSAPSNSGILKPPSQNNNNSISHLFNFQSSTIQRKSVSFCDQDNVKVYVSSSSSSSDDDEDDYSDNEDSLLKLPEMSECKKDFVPTFVFPPKKPNYAQKFRKKILCLEHLDVCTEDCSIIGTIRVNLSRIRDLETKEQKKNGQKICIGVNYTFDNWTTTLTSKALVVRSSVVKHNPELDDINSVFMRFTLDVDDLEIGDSLQFNLWCIDKISAAKHPIKYQDTNDGSHYRIKCTPALNPWAAKAASQLRNFVPTVRYNRNFFPTSDK